ncbi:MAG: Rrf2 family transcriptional regulator [Candidatus Omnitrophica bacterium]|nr:Rrf2 family transcriptional regulator [Candidatus Omnitrophota bacterium]MBI2495872.1 Rrf2 family transcriptional regulator [Candidatus Omnitrophota bacterium]MBI3021644.1 Rrf2 family transcriptional regulator [Candidatus Omnitrophota bacterium]MBI3083372.1 Rrf2 family transcriptional regulator [Candidatus Omnitrophota bacterium]
MKITAPEEYGLRCLLQLARAPQHQVVRVKDVAAKEGLSSAYVEKLLRLLSRAGLVHSLRGIKGGYMLNRPSSAITLGEVVRALGTVQTTDHICHQFTGNEAACVHFTSCGIRSVWSGLTTYIQNFLDQTSLSSLLEDEYVVAERLSKRFAA